MNMRLLSRIFVFALLILVLISIISAAAATNTIPPTRLSDQTRPITANDLKPVACAALNLTSILICGSSSSVCNGKNSGELILGSPITTKINGHTGTNCCLGAPGTTFTNCTWHN